MAKLNMGSIKSLAVAIGFLGLTTMSCTKSDESLLPNQSEIEARRGGPKGGGTTPPATGIPAVTGLTVTAISPTEVSLTWNSVPNATTYWIIRNGYVPAIIPGTNYIDRGLTGGTSYTYEIAAVVNEVRGPVSASVTVTTPR